MLCDLIGRICDEEGRNFYIFVAKDHYSKWMETGIAQNKTGKAIANAFIQLVIDKHGTPESLLTDHGKEFEKKNLATYLKNTKLKNYGICLDIMKL